MKAIAKHSSSVSLKIKVKFFIEKLIKKFGQEKLAEVFPSEHQKLLKAIVKSLQRQKNKDNREKETRKKTRGEKGGHQQTSDSTKLESVNEEDAMMDLLNVNSMKTVTNDSAIWNLTGRTKDNIESSFAVSKGKLVINDDVVKNGRSNKKRKRVDNDDNNNDNNSVSDDEEASEEVLDEPSDKEGKRTSTSQFTNNNGNNSMHSSMVKNKLDAQNQFGGLYKSKSGGGDKKILGKPDPYAVIHLDPRNLNKRKSKRSSSFHLFQKTVDAAKQGALRGGKQRHKRRKMK